MTSKLFSCLVLLSLAAVSLVGCGSGDGVKADESMEGAFKQAKKEGVQSTPPPSKSSSKKAVAPTQGDNNTPQ